MLPGHREKNRSALPVPRLFHATVRSNDIICREHYRLELEGPDLRGARPGQFLHLGPARIEYESAGHLPYLRRAFSIAGLRTMNADRCALDVIYRVVGTATRWMAGLHPGDRLSALGPLGNAFPVDETKPHAWMVGGGVGLPPLLWLAESLQTHGRRAVAIVGARTADLLPLRLTDRRSLSRDARTATPAAAEFARCDTPVVVATDDGSLGFRGHAPAALAAHFAAAGLAPEQLVVYTCGPEPMMRAVAEFCLERDIACQACLERAMACATGTCQSCVVPVHDASALDGWRYELCCTHGPVFDARRVIWRDPA